MNQAKAYSKYIRVSPRKARLVADLIRGMNVEEAFLQLMYSNAKAGKLIKKTLNSAVANAEVLFGAKREALHVKEIRVDVGPTLKRSKSKSKGGRAPIMKRMSHFTVVVSEKGKES